MKPGEAPDYIVAKAMGITPRQVFEIRKKEGIPSFPRKRKKRDYTEVDKLLEEGLSIRAIQDKTGMDRNAVWKRKRQLETK